MTVSDQTCSSFPHNGVEWEDVEDWLVVLLYNDPFKLQLFWIVYSAGVRHPAVLASLAILVSLEEHEINQFFTSSWSLTAAGEILLMAEASLKIVAEFLVNTRSRILQSHCIRLLLKSKTAISTAQEEKVESGIFFHEKWVKPVLKFCLGRRQGHLRELLSGEASSSINSLVMLLWELRLLCQQELHRLRTVRHEKILQGANRTSYCLWAGARVVQQGVSISTRFVTDQVLERTGVILCDRVSRVPPRERKYEEEEKVDDRRAESLLVQTYEYTNAAKRATETTCFAAKRAVTDFQEASKRGLSIMVYQLPSVDIDEDYQVVLQAAGQVSLAGVGAISLVGDAVADSTKEVWYKSAEVTAEIIQHKYGPIAGQSVRDAADTVGNIIGTVGCLAVLDGTTIPTNMARDTGKAHLLSQV